MLADAQGLDQCRELLGKRREALEQYLAAAQVREVRLVALAKAREHAAFLVHVLDAQAGAASIGKRGALQRLDHVLRSNAADALEVVEQLPLLGGELRLGREVLQGTAAADPEVRTARHDPVGRGRDDFEQHGLFEPPPALGHAEADTLSRQGALDEHRLAIEARDAAPVVREIDDVGLERLAGLQLSGHAARNSCR